jgi:hypothetical protein
VKHAGPAALDGIEPLLAEIRAAAPQWVEKKRGTFYWRAKAYLHFHEDPTGMYADLRLSESGDFERFRATTPDEQAALVQVISASQAALS